LLCHQPEHDLIDLQALLHLQLHQDFQLLPWQVELYLQPELSLLLLLKLALLLLEQFALLLP
jgi:hypothetical protein